MFCNAGRSNSHHRRLAELALLAWGVAGFTCNALAQSAGNEAQKAQTGPLEEVTVTGSLIQRTGMSTPTPVTTVTGTQLRDMAPGRLIDGLSELPQFFGNMTPQTTTWWDQGLGGGLNLRGAGLNRTLVLLDGRRLTANNREGIVNISDIPEPFIQRIETVTGGASAAYGTGAVAGVVNFILNTNFKGLEARLKGGSTDYSDGRSRGVTLAYGTDIGKRLHFQVSGDFYHQDGIWGLKPQQRRGFYNQVARITNPDPNGPAQIIRQYVSPTNFSYTGIINAPGSQLDKMEFVNTPNGVSVQPLAFSGVGDLEGGCNCQAEPTQTYGVNKDHTILNENQTENLFAYFNYDVSDKINVYFQGMWANSYQATPWQGINLNGPWQATIFSGNPFLPSSVQDIMNQEGLQSIGFGLLGRNNSSTPLGTDTAKTKNELGAGTVGFKIRLGDNWSLNGYAENGKSLERNLILNSTRTDTLFLGLDAVRNPVTGAIECRAAEVNPAAWGDCVPIDLFGGVQNLTPAMAKYLLNPRTMLIASDTRQTVGQVVASGDIAKGWGAGPISMAAGASYRRNTMSTYVPDLRDEFVYYEGQDTHLRGLVPEDQPNGMLGVRPGSVPPGYLGNNNLSVNVFTASIQNYTASTAGSSTVPEVFSEFNIPLLSDKPLARQLSVNVAARHANYSGSGGIWAWKYGVNWQVNDVLRVRGTRSRDVRAATLRERFEQTGTGATVQDPVLGGIIYSTQARVGGNPNVAPEKADTYTLGVVYQPSSAPGLGVTLDWYSMNINGAIAQPRAQDIVNLCFEGATNLCQLLTRDPTTQRISSIDEIYTNLSNQRVSGADFEMDYRKNSLNARLLATWLQENSIKSPGAPRDDRAGQVGTGFSLPRWKVTANIGKTIGPVNVFVQERWIDSGILDRFAVQGVTIDNNSVPSVAYTDLHFSYTGPFASGGNWEAYAQISNLFNRAPPVTPGQVGRSGTNEFNQALYDVLGRRFMVGLNVTF